MKAKTSHSEQLFRKTLQRRLSEAELTPPPAVWNQIESQLTNKRKKRGLLIWWTGIAASILIFVALGWLIYDHPFTRSHQDNAKPIAVNPVWVYPAPVKTKKASSDTKSTKPVEGSPKNNLRLPNQLPTPSSSGTKNNRWSNPMTKVILPSDPETVQAPISVILAKNILLSSTANDSTLIAANQPALVQLPESEILAPPIRKVYGIGFGKYKIKISLASKE